MRQDIDRLDKQIKSPKKFNLQTKGFNTGSIAGGAGLGSRAMGMAVAGGSALGGLAAGALSKLVNVLSAAVPALLKFGLGIDNVNGLMKKWSGTLDTYSNAPERAMTNADSMDALDDERRAHGTKTLAEEFGWSEAYRNVGGADFNNQILTRVETLVEQAKAGNIEAIDTIKSLDTLKGYTDSVGDSREMTPDYAIASHLNEMNTYEVLAEILKGYHNAKAEGDYTKIDALTKFLGRRGVGIANKLNDVSEVERQKEIYAEDWKRIHTNETTVMAAAGVSEIERSRGKIYNYGVPSGGEQNIINGALNEAASNKMAYKALAGTNSEIIDGVSDEFSKDWDETVNKIKSSPVAEALNESVIEPLKKQGVDFAAAAQSATDAIKESIVAVANADATLTHVKKKINRLGDITNWPGIAAEGAGIAFNQSVNAGEKFIKSVGVDDDIRKGFNAELDFRLNAAAAGFKFISPFLP